MSKEQRLIELLYNEVQELRDTTCHYKLMYDNLLRDFTRTYRHNQILVDNFLNEGSDTVQLGDPHS